MIYNLIMRVVPTAGMLRFWKRTEANAVHSQTYQILDVCTHSPVSPLVEDMEVSMVTPVEHVSPLIPLLVSGVLLTLFSTADINTLPGCHQKGWFSWEETEE